MEMTLRNCDSGKWRKNLLSKYRNENEETIIMRNQWKSCEMVRRRINMRFKVENKYI